MARPPDPTAAVPWDRWPHIRRALRMDPSGAIADSFGVWDYIRRALNAADRAAGYEEWADFYEWHLSYRADELADDRLRYSLVARWTDSMAYCCRRLAAYERGEDPGPAVPQWERRPDLAYHRVRHVAAA